MKKILIFIIAMVTIQTASAQKLSLENMITEALENNYSIRLVKKQVEIADNNLTVGNAGMLPRLDASAGYNYQLNSGETELNPQIGTIISDNNVTTAYNYGVQLNWTLFDGMAMFTTFDKLDLLKQQSYLQLRISMESMVRDIMIAYYKALNLQLNLGILKDNLELSSQRLQRAEDRKEYGASVSIEVLAAQVDYNRDSVSLLETELAFNTVKRNISLLLGRKNHDDFILDETLNNLTIPELNELKEQTFEFNSSVRNAVLNNEISEKDKGLIVSQYLPRISFNSGYTFNNSESESGFPKSIQSNGFSAGITASINLFDGFKTNTMAQNADIRIDMNRISQQQILALIDMNLMTNYQTYLKRKDIQSLEQMNLETAKANYYRTYDMFKLGQVTSLELREAQLNLLRTRIMINSAQINTIISEHELKLISGTYFD